MRKLCASMLAVICGLSVSANPVDLLPQGGVITNGNGRITVNGAVMTIDQLSNRTISQWDSFNIGVDAGVNIDQPASSSAFLARVMGADPSTILGRLSSNGHVYLTSPGGVVFGQKIYICM